MTKDLTTEVDLTKTFAGINSVQARLDIFDNYFEIPIVEFLNFIGIHIRGDGKYSLNNSRMSDDNFDHEDPVTKAAYEY